MLELQSDSNFSNTDRDFKSVTAGYFSRSSNQLSSLGNKNGNELVYLSGLQIPGIHGNSRMEFEREYPVIFFLTNFTSFYDPKDICYSKISMS